MNKIISVIPVILAGGSGVRLWPASNKRHPKQFSKIIGKQSPFQDCVNRFQFKSTINFTDPIVMTNNEYEFIVADQLAELGVKPISIIIEPEVRDTASAILVASIYAKKLDPEAIVIIAPSDHLIPDEDAFNASVIEGLRFINDKKIITFGAIPDRPETGYGYLKFLGDIESSSMRLDAFVEKPSLEDAIKMLKTECFLWNMGILLFKVDVIIESFEAYYPILLQPVHNSLDNGICENQTLRLDPVAWSQCESTSIDYAVMEQSTNLVVVPFRGRWSDLGDWQAVWRESNKDNSGLVVSEGSIGIDCENTLLYSKMDSQKIVGIGLKNIIAVSTTDGVLVMNKDQSQRVKEAVGFLKIKGLPIAEDNSKTYRPWGHLEIMAYQENFQVQLIKVNPGCQILLNNQENFSGNWTILEGKAQVKNTQGIRVMESGQLISSSDDLLSRIKNIEKKPLIIIEVRTGTVINSHEIYDS